MAESGTPDRSSSSSAPPPRPPAPIGGAEPSTRTHGFLFADLRDYTSYVDERGDHAGAELLRRYRALVRDGSRSKGPLAPARRAPMVSMPRGAMTRGPDPSRRDRAEPTARPTCG